MKVLFAVSNDNVSSSIIKKYQEKYKEIITNKNVYYFNAIIKELQKDKTYDIVVIGEDLEPISNNNYDTIDKFIFEKLDNISDEACKVSGEDIPIILICSDRRTKSDALLIKLFGIGIYNALLGNDRNIDMVCDLINKPRNKKEAKNYYRIESEDVNYKPEKESEVSENEIQNILSHYKKIGNNEKKCIQSFDSIASQYNDTQLRIITKFLPLNVKAILESGSPRYQRLMTGGTVLSNGEYNKYNDINKKPNEQNIDFLSKDLEKPNLTKPVIIPSNMDMSEQNNRSFIQKTENQNMGYPVQNQNRQNIMQNQNMGYQGQNQNSQNIMQNQNMGYQGQNQNSQNMMQNQNMGYQGQNQNSQNIMQNQNMGYQGQTQNNQNMMQMPNKRPIMQNNFNQSPYDLSYNPYDNIGNINQTDNNNINNLQEIKNVNEDSNSGLEENVINEVQAQEQPKRRGRPKKVTTEEPKEEQTPKRGRGRPKKVVPLAENIEPKQEDSIDLFGLADISNDLEKTEEIEQNNNIPQDNNGLQDINLFDMSVETDSEPNISENNSYENQNFSNPYINNTIPNEQVNPYDLYNNSNEVINENPTVDINSNPYDAMPNDNLLRTNNKNNNIIESNFIARNSKLVAFVGTSKNGTSFIVNNLAELLSQRGINTAILDLTKNKNSYYMFTDNNQNLMQTASNSIKNLSRGNVQGVAVNKNLTVFTSLPGDDQELENIDTILQTLDSNYSAVLMDCDFETNINYFVKATEIYLVQSMDALTIQPLTLFLSELKLKNALDENKLRVIINKEVKLKILNDRMILGGMAKYNEPSMTLQRDLFNPNTIRYVKIPFEEQTYARYLEAIAICQISLGGYSERFLASLNELANMVYPLIPGGGNQNNQTTKKGLFKSKDKNQVPTQFSSGVNGTLDKMRNTY